MRFTALILILFLPLSVFASCTSAGDTVVYVNGIISNKDQSQQDVENLRDKYYALTGDNSISFFNAYNQTHSTSTDIYKVITQLLLWNPNTWNEDTNGDAILNQIHKDLETQKVVLVGHSQGSFYSNETYKYLTTHGMSPSAVAVFNVATPTSYIAGYGKYVTSSNDSVINLVRTLRQQPGTGNLPEPLPANVNIPIPADDSTGHGFSTTYLAEDGDNIVTAIQNDILGLSPTSSIDTSDCFTPPETSIAHKTAVSLANLGSSLGTFAYVWGAGAVNGTIAAVDSAFGAAHQMVSDVGTYAGGVNGLFHAGEKKYQSTNFNIVSHLTGGNNEQVDGESLNDMANGNPSQGGAVILATVQGTNKPTYKPAAPSNPVTPTVPINPAPGFSPGGGGSSPVSVAADPAPQTQAAASVPGVDTTAPVISSTSDISVQAANSSATSSVVTYTTPTATDTVDGSVSVSCTPVSGSDFGVGTTTVICNATDIAGNTATSTFNVGVYVPPVPPPATEPIVINEIAWGGSYGAPNEQWIELYNNGNDDVSLGDVVLLSTDGSIYVPLSGTIVAHGYYILATTENSIFNLKNSGWNHGVSASLALSSTPVQLVLSRTNGSATTTLDETPAPSACGGNWCAGAAAATDGYSAAGGNPPMPVTMERVNASVVGTDGSNWASADGYDRYAYDFNQQWIIGTPYNPNSSHWPMVGFVCAGDTSTLTPGSTYTYRPASNSCHYLSGYVGRDWTAVGVLLKGTVGSSTIVTLISNGSGPYKDLQTDASHYYDFANASSGDTFTVVFFNYNNNVGGQYNAYYLGDMHHYLETGFQNDGTTASAPYSYQTLSFVIP